MRQIVSESEFRTKFTQELDKLDSKISDCQYVTGPGRSGAVAAVYASYYLRLTFISWGHLPPGPVLLVDTARMSGKTLRKAMGKYRYHSPMTAWAYDEPPIVKFWYEVY